MITGGDLRQSRLDVGYKTFTISPWMAKGVSGLLPDFRYTSGILQHLIDSNQIGQCK